MKPISSFVSRGLIVGLAGALACSPALAAKPKPTGPKVVVITLSLSVLPTTPEH